MACCFGDFSRPHDFLARPGGVEHPRLGIKLWEYSPLVCILRATVVEAVTQLQLPAGVIVKDMKRLSSLHGL